MEISKRHRHEILCLMTDRLRASCDIAYLPHPFRITQHTRRKWECQGNLLEV